MADPRLTIYIFYSRRHVNLRRNRTLIEDSERYRLGYVNYLGTWTPHTLL